MENLFQKIENALRDKVFRDGLSRYEQSNTKVTLETQGYHIFRTPNKSQSADGNTMWGGLKIYYGAGSDSKTGTSLLTQGHTYIIMFDVVGQTSNAINNIGWTNNMGWSGGGLNPTPTNVKKAALQANFQGHQLCFYKFTASDALSKPCTSAYDNYVEGTTYLSYRHFEFRFAYVSDTGIMGTDIYLSNFQMYDITSDNMYHSIYKNGNAKFLNFTERSGVLSLVDTFNLPRLILTDKSKWCRIFYHNCQAGETLFADYKEALNVQTTNKYSRLCLIDNFIGIDGKFEFLLRYPNDSTTTYNRWKQTENPCKAWYGTSDGSLFVAGYEAIHIDWTTNYWGGLARNNSSETSAASCFISGSVGHSNWYYAIGATGKYNDGIPTAAALTSSGSTAGAAELWIRYDHLLDSKPVSIYDASLYCEEIIEI